MRAHGGKRRSWAGDAAFVLVVMSACGLQGQTTAPAQPAPAATQSAPVTGSVATPEARQAVETAQAKPARNSDRRRAEKFYLEASKLFVDEKFEEAMRSYQQAATLDPGNRDYPLAANVARSHAVTALIQAASKDRLRGDAAAARAALAHALELEPGNLQINQHLYELGDDALLGQTRPLYEQSAGRAGEGVELAPAGGVHSFHLRADQKQIIQQVFKAYGIEATVDASIHGGAVRLDVDDAGFETAARIVGLLTASFYVPLDAHRVLAAHDSHENRQQFTRLDLETVYLSGLSAMELTDVVNLAKNVFSAQQAVAEPSSGTITIRAPQGTLNAFNATMSSLLDGRSQVMLDIRVIQLAHTSERNTGVQPPQSISAFNIYTEEQSILNANHHQLRPGRPRRHDGDSRHSAGLRSGLQFPVHQRHCAFWRRADAIRAVSGRGERKSESELLGFARARSIAVAPGRRRGRDAAHRHALSYPDLFVFELGEHCGEHTGTDGSGQFRQPLFAAGRL